MGGGEIALLNLVCALDHDCYRPIVVLASDGSLVEKLRAGGIETYVEPLDASVLETRKDNLGPKSVLRFRQAYACLRYTMNLARLARRLGANLIHTNSLKADLYGGLAGRLAGIPVIWHVRDSIDEHYLPSFVAAAFRKFSRIIPRFVVANSESTLRSLHFHARSSNPRGANSRRTFEVVHDGCPTEDYSRPDDLDSTDENEGVSKAFSSPEGNCGCVPPSQRPERPIIVLVGRIAEWKGQHIFIQAAAAALLQFPQARFWIVGAPLFGEDEYEQALRQMVLDLGIMDQVEFLGFRDDVPALLTQATIVVHASTLGEPFGQVVIEGMAAGKPVIATDGGALPEIVLPGETGLLVPMGDAPAMAEAIMTLLADPVRAAGMGQAGQKRVQSQFTISHTARKIEMLYDYLLK